MEATIQASFLAFQAGVARLAFDAETGLLVARTTSQVINQPRSSYRSDVTYQLARVGYGDARKADLFRWHRVSAK